MGKEVLRLVLALCAASPILAQGPLRVLPGAAPGWTEVRQGGDVNADGFTDLVVFRDAIDNQDKSVRVYSGIDGSVLHDFLGDPTMPYLTCASAGDTDGDGHDDVVIGSWLSGLAGRVRVHSGADGSVLHDIPGALFTESFFGRAVFPAGDVDGDGFDDFGVTLREGSTGDFWVRVFSGSSGFPVLNVATSGDGRAVESAGDVDGDGFDDIVADGVDLLGSTQVIHIFSGRNSSLIREIPKSVFGPLASNLQAIQIDGAGDVDRDGFDDVIVGMPFSNTVSVISGNTGNMLYTYTNSVGRYGYVTGAGDVNGDGQADFAVGARLADGSLTDSGALYVYSGADGSLIQSFFGSQQDEQLGFTVDGGAGCDVDGDGYDDVLAGTWASIAYAYDLGATGTPGRLRPRGVGCVGSLGGLPTIDARGYALLGDSFDVELRGGIPAGVATLLVGSPTELALDPAGLIGCTLYTAGFFSVGVTNDNFGMATVPVSVPGNPLSVGLTLSMQWISWDAGATPIAARVSGGLDVTVGQ